MTPPGERRLAIFDIDGTLTDTCGLDDECYVAALAANFGYPAESNAYDWTGFEDVTDRGIVTELCRREGKVLDSAAFGAFERDFVDRVATGLRRDPSRGREVAGAVDFVAGLHRDPGWEIAFATGGFRASALLKLLHAGFDPPEVLGSADDATRRAAIVEIAIVRAREAYDATFRSVVLFGDAPWDMTTAAELGWPCVGRGTGERGAELERAGAVAVLPDYRNLAQCHRALTGAVAVAEGCRRT